jgi:hypothetical protein
MTCIHGLGSSVLDYVISNILISKKIVNYDLLNDNEPDSDHRPLTLTLKFSMHMKTIEENSNNQRHMLFDESKVDLFLMDLNRELHLLTYKDNMKSSVIILQLPFPPINKFSFEVSCKKNNRTTNPWYDKECKISRKSIRDAYNESLKLDKINTYKSLIKRKKKDIISIKSQSGFHSFLSLIL